MSMVITDASTWPWSVPTTRHALGQYQRLDMALGSSDVSTWSWSEPTPQHGLSQYQHLDIAVVSTDSLTWPDVSSITAVCLAVLLLHHFIALSSSFPVMVSFSHSLDFPPIGCIHTLEFTATGDRSFLYLFRLLALFSWIGSFLVPVCQRCPTPLRRVLLVTVCQPNFSLLVAVCRLVLDQLCVSSRSRLTFVLWICIPSPSHATKTSVSGVVTSISQELVRRLLHHSRRLQGRRHRGQGAAAPQKN